MNLNNKKDKLSKLELALRKNLKKRKSFQKKNKKKSNMILNDKQIKKLVEEEEMISPFVDKLVHKGISHGLGTFGYDIRCGDEFKIFSNVRSNL